MDLLEYIKIAGALGAGGLFAKLLDKILRHRNDEVDAEDTINAMAIRQLQQQMAQMAQQVARYEALEKKFNDLREKYNQVILENTQLKMRITELEKAQQPKNITSTNERPAQGVAP
jgi:regulator of replication initiation timing